jgi:hypothetical protein
MAWKKLAVLAAVGMGFALPALANDAYLGLGLGLTPGNPKFSQSGDPAVQLAFELQPEEWRFSFEQVTFDSTFKPKAHLQSQVFGAEKLFVHKFDNRFSMNGGIGIGYYQIALSGSESGTGSAFGLMASVAGRYQINQQFFTDLQLQYRNAAIAVDSQRVFDAGWTGVGIDFGFIF